MSEVLNTATWGGQPRSQTIKAQYQNTAVVNICCYTSTYGATGVAERVNMKRTDLVGKRIRIIDMQGEPRYCGKEGIVQVVDDIGQLHGTWGGCAVIPGEDSYEVIKENDNG